MTMQGKQPLTDAQLRLVLDAMALLPSGESHELACPRCGAMTLTVERTPCPPHLVWFELACSGCGLSERVQLTAGAAD